MRALRPVHYGAHTGSPFLQKTCEFCEKILMPSLIMWTQKAAWKMIRIMVEPPELSRWGMCLISVFPSGLLSGKYLYLILRMLHTFTNLWWVQEQDSSLHKQTSLQFLWTRPCNEERTVCRWWWWGVHSRHHTSSDLQVKHIHKGVVLHIICVIPYSFLSRNSGNVLFCFFSVL